VPELDVFREAGLVLRTRKMTRPATARGKGRIAPARPAGKLYLRTLVQMGKVRVTQVPLSPPKVMVPCSCSVSVRIKWSPKPPAS
jgi:hypothetical protein